jgi:hypothetical protein
MSMKPEYDCPMIKKWSILLAFIILGAGAYPQSNSVDSVITPTSKTSVSDSTIDPDVD